MKIYAVGGCIRDLVLGKQPKDYDYVVVGATPQHMLDLDFSQVGSSFPVFLHPMTGEEFALARTERKTGVGYNGFETVFDSSVTLQQDLIRRDLTINSMAKPVRFSQHDRVLIVARPNNDVSDVIDYFGGIDDCKRQVLRHTSEAFAEDPVRILRTARFAARYGFTIDASTIDLMRKVVPELKFVPQERIWSEIERGLMERSPLAMFEALSQCGALDEGNPLSCYRQYDKSALANVKEGHGLAVRFALTNQNFATKDYVNYRVPTDVALVGYTFNACLNLFQRYDLLKHDARLSLLEHTRAFSHPMLLMQCLDAFSYYAVPDEQVTAETITSMIVRDLHAAKSVNAAEIASNYKDGKQIKKAIQTARIEAMVKADKSPKQVTQPIDLNLDPSGYLNP